MYGFSTLMAHQEAEGAAAYYRPLGCEGSSLTPPAGLGRAGVRGWGGGSGGGCWWIFFFPVGRKCLC